MLVGGYQTHPTIGGPKKAGGQLFGLEQPVEGGVGGGREQSKPSLAGGDALPALLDNRDPGGFAMLRLVAHRQARCDPA